MKRFFALAAAVVGLSLVPVVAISDSAEAASWKPAGGCVVRNGDVKGKVYLDNTCTYTVQLRATFTCANYPRQYKYTLLSRNSSTTLTTYGECWYYALYWYK